MKQVMVIAVLFLSALNAEPPHPAVRAPIVTMRLSASRRVTSSRQDAVGCIAANMLNRQHHHFVRYGSMNVNFGVGLGSASRMRSSKRWRTQDRSTARGVPMNDSDLAVSRVAAAIGEPARARILYYLMDGHAGTSTELSVVAGGS